MAQDVYAGIADLLGWLLTYTVTTLTVRILEFENLQSFF